MVDDARFVTVKSLKRKPGGTEINIVPNTFARSVSPEYGFEHSETLRFSLKKAWSMHS